MTTITRRQAISALASATAGAGTAFTLPAISQPADAPPVLAATPAVSDPLLDAIRAYRDGDAAYERHPIGGRLDYTDEEMEAAVAGTYGPPLEALEEWEAPAKSCEGALEALRLIRDENADFASSPVVGPMLAAALAYFEAQS